MMTKKIVVSGLIFLFISCASGHHKPFEEKLSPVRDLSAGQAHIQLTVSSSPFLTLKKIGQIAYDGFQAPIWCVSFRSDAPISYRVLINAGIHGNEPASVACAMQFVEDLADNPDRYSTVAIDIISIVNPWGWVHDIRYNRDGLDINRDFSTFYSQEAKIITGFVQDKQYDLMLDLHEDHSARGFYIYQYGAEDKTISQAVVETIKKLGYPLEDKISMVILKAENGIIDAPMLGLWYMRFTGQLALAPYYRLNNTRRAYTIETPTSLPMADRLTMQRMAVDVLISAHTPEP